MEHNALRKARKNIKDSGAVAAEGLGQQYLDAIADIRRRMNIAKMEALRAAEAPFLADLKEIEEEYAAFLTLAS